MKIICTSWGKKKKKGWEVIEKEEVKSPANERGNIFSPEFRISVETLVETFVSLPLSVSFIWINFRMYSYSVYCCGWYFRSCFQKNRCISALFKLCLVVTSRIFVSKTNKKDNFSIWDICLLILQKHFWECRLSLRDTRGLREPGFHCPLSCSPHTYSDGYNSFIWPCFFKVYSLKLPRITCVFG